MKAKIAFLIIFTISAIAIANDNSPGNPELRADKVKTMFDEFLADDSEGGFSLVPQQKFQWSDVPKLLKLAEDDSKIDKMPALMISSYAGQKCIKGMVALWFIEGLREKQNEITLQKQILKDVTAKTFYRLPLNPFCTQKGMKLEDCEANEEIYKEVLKAYQQWWQMVKDLEPHHAACFDPLAISDCQWYGSRRFHRKTDLYFVDTLLTFFELDLSARIIKQTIYVPKASLTGSADGTTADFYQPYKCVLFYYSDENKMEKTEEIVIEKNLSTIPDEKLRRQLLNLRHKEQ